MVSSADCSALLQSSWQQRHPFQPIQVTSICGLRGTVLRIDVGINIKRRMLLIMQLFYAVFLKVGTSKNLTNLIIFAKRGM